MRDMNHTENDPELDPPAKVDSPQRIGPYWVQFRSGLHRKDVGLVVSEPNSLNTVVVKVVPRINTEGDLAAEGRKRRRQPNTSKDLKRRPPQRLYDAGTLRQIFGRDSVKELNKGFRFNRWTFTSDGFRLIKLPVRQLVEYHPFVDEISSFTEKIVNGDVQEHPIPSFTIPSFVEVGDRVSVIKGENEGASGVVARLEEDGDVSITVDIATGATSGEASEEMEAVQISCELKCIRRVFEVGQSVEVRVGHLKDTGGLVIGVNEQDLEILHTKEHYTVRSPVLIRLCPSNGIRLQFSVPSAFCVQIRDCVEAPATRSAADSDRDNLLKVLDPDAYWRIPHEVRQLYEAKKKQKLLPLETAIDAVARAYNRQPVYVIRGTFKGSFGKVVSMNDSLVNILFDAESVWGDQRDVDIPRTAVVA